MSRHATAAMTPSTNLKSKTLDNKYMLGDEIGKGAYGRVYKGLDLENGAVVAIKQVSLENIAQEDLNIIMQEIDLLKNLNHKNIVKYLGSLKTKSHLFIILEYVENGSLANIIKPNKFGPFPESLVVVYISQILEGLVYLHEQGVIHRDIKGANILTTKEGLVKLADFGVATKLTEADVNTHSVVGTPYWMAPEVIEMSGVCAASDIWSVGCTVIELLTCVPPYYDLQPMPALFRIVQDEHPPIPDGLSPDLNDFLRQCFKKDARQRSDAKTLLSHAWIKNSRPALPSLRDSGSIRSIQEDPAIDIGPYNVALHRSDNVVATDNVGAKSTQNGTDPKSDLLNEDLRSVKYKNNHPLSESMAGGTEDMKKDPQSDQVPTFVIHEKPDKALKIGEIESAECSAVNISKIRDWSSNVSENENGVRDPDNLSQKVIKNPAAFKGNDLSRFSDLPKDALIDDLFHTPVKALYGSVSEASTSTPISNIIQNDTESSDLATILRTTILQKQTEHAHGGGDFFQLMLNALKNGTIDINGLGVNNKLSAENLFPLQAVEFSRLLTSLRPEESEDVIEASCQKLITIFRQRPEQKHVFCTQLGLLPLLELLDIPKPRVTCSVLQLINQIVKDNTVYLENACLVGLIPVVMSFAGPDSTREVRMEAAFFLQRLCQSSSLTLQMFIACRGIPILVGFLEPDYAKFRDMVHLAINGMWQIFKLHRSSPRNDFCRIAAKNGILFRLVNTLYSLNEATRLVSIAQDGFSSLPRSGQLDPSHSSFLNDQSISTSELPDLTKSKKSMVQSSSGTHDPPYTSSSASQHFDAFHPVHITDDSLQSSPLLPAKIMETSSDKPANLSGKDLPLAESLLLESYTRNQRVSNVGNISSVDKPPKLIEAASNALNNLAISHADQVRPLLSLLEKEPPSKHFSGHLYTQHISALDRNENMFPILHAPNEKKSNGELGFVMEEFAATNRGKDGGNVDPKIPSRTAMKKPILSSPNEGTSTNGITSQTTSGVLSGSGVLNARAGSAASSGLLSHMVFPMNADVSREYLEKVADLLLEFSNSDTTVKFFMCSQSLLTRLFQMFNRIELPILLKILQCIHNLSKDPNCLESLQRADAIKYLIPNLELKDGHLVDNIYNEVLNALFNLCKINKRRQEQAAENGIIPHLMHFIMSDSPLKQCALPLLCDMAHASRNSREQLRAHGGLDVYLSLLDDISWSVTALDSIAVCLAHDNDSRKVEQSLLKKEAIQKLVKFFQICPEQQFVHILEPFWKIITKSSRINTTLAVNGLTTLLIARLDHQDAIARLNLLKLIKAVYEHHPRPKQLIVENDLPNKLQNLIEERRDGQSSGGQVLVKQMATSLLKALHINTVL